MQKESWKKIGVGALITLYALAGTAVLGLYSLQSAYAERIYPGVTLAGVDFSGKNWDTAAKDVEQLLLSLQETTIPIVVEGGQTFNPTLTELGVEFDKNSILANLFAIGHGVSFWNGVLSALKSYAGPQPVDLAATFNKSALKRYVDETTKSLAKPPKNATLKVVNGIVEVEPSQIGEEADPDYLMSEITARLQVLHMDSGVLVLPPIYLEIAKSIPDITDSEVAGVKTKAQEMVGEPVSTFFEDKTYTFTQADIGEWIVFEEVGEGRNKSYEPQFSDAKIMASIAAKVAKNIDIKMAPKRILITTGQIVDEGRDGRTLDRNKLLAEIKQHLANRTRSPIALVVSDVPKTEQQVYPDFTLGLYEGRYIEINLTKQKMYAIEGNTLVNEYLISSGLEWGGYATPTGTMYIINKVGFAYSRPYNLWMPYWNGLSTTTDISGYRGYGIHELPCFNRSCTRREGINHLGRPASHGCIRLGHNGPAAFIYDWAPVGTPVYIHR